MLLANDVELYQTESGKLIISDDSDEGIYTHIDLLLMQAGMIDDTVHYATFAQAHDALEPFNKATPRHEYITPFRCSYRYQCHYSFESWFIDEAIENAYSVNSFARVLVDADCTIWDEPRTAKVGIDVYKLRGKSHPELFAMFDKEIDEFIAYRTRHRSCNTP